jgi:hypothetical protein
MYITPNYILKPVRAAAILTNSYVAGTVLTDCESYNQLFVDAYFTIGSLTNAIIKVEFSWDGTNYTQEAFGAVSGAVETESLGTHLMAGTGNYSISVPIVARYVKISAIGTGTVTDSSLKIDARFGTV